jgi:hypothetical protein
MVFRFTQACCVLYTYMRTCTHDTLQTRGRKTRTRNQVVSCVMRAYSIRCCHAPISVRPSSGPRGFAPFPKGTPPGRLIASCCNITLHQRRQRQSLSELAMAHRPSTPASASEGSSAHATGNSLHKHRNPITRGRRRAFAVYAPVR